MFPVVTCGFEPVTSHLPLLRSDLPIHSGRAGAGDGAINPDHEAGDDGGAGFGRWVFGCPGFAENDESEGPPHSRSEFDGLPSSCAVVGWLL